MSELGDGIRGRGARPGRHLSRRERRTGEQSENDAMLGAGLAIGIGLGTAIGVGLGVALHNLAIGIAVGVSLGAGIGIALGVATRGLKNQKD